MIDDLEQLIRATLSDDAQRAPQVDDLAARVAAAADASGRRRALTVTSLSAAAAIAAVAVSGTLAPGVGGAGATVIPGVASATSTSTAPAPSTAPGTYRGVIPTTPPEAQAPRTKPPSRLRHHRLH